MSVRALANAAEPNADRRGESSSTSASVDPRCSNGTNTPVVPSTTLLWCPFTSVATAGVPHAAASVRVSPHPSASEALVTNHADW